MKKGDILTDHPVKGKGGKTVSGEIIRVTKALVTIKLSKAYVGDTETWEKGKFKFFNIAEL